MIKDAQYRYENKYIISNTQAIVLYERLKNIMPLDLHAQGQSFYRIKSLYFDDIDNSCYYDNANGVNKRKKYRVRYYNDDDSYIVLECKYKEQYMTCKESVRLSKDEAENLINGSNFSPSANNCLLNSFLALRKTSVIKPVVITIYERVPLVYKLGNVRITFDRNLSSSVDITNFFSGNITSRPVFSTGTSLLEVKYDGFIPDYIHEMLEIGSLHETAFSKYCFCRKINMRG